jgi:hypothetical protein
MKPSMKQIVYRGGIAQFCLPASWVEEYEPAGGGTFYEDKPGTGTLRVNVMDLKKKSGDSPSTETAHDLLLEISKANSVESLPNGVALARSTRGAIENGEQLLLHTWHIGVRMTPSHFRIIVFTYTILAKQESTRDVQQEIAMLDGSISKGDYPAVEGVAGNYPP